MTDAIRQGAGRAASDGGTTDEDRVLVLNPVSGDEAHADTVRDLAADHGFDVRETAGEGDAIDLAAAAARDGADLVAAAGGDGTLNEVVRGLVAAEALEDVTFAVVPAGTGNNFAGNIGVESIDHAFGVVETGDRRTIDLGLADDRPFLNSCIGGLTAAASAETDADTKATLGEVAYVLNTFRTALGYEGVTLDIETATAHEDVWSGEAVMLLAGNGRRFPVRGRTQANVEDGLLDVAVVEEPPRFDLAGLAASTALERLLGVDADNVVRLTTPGLAVTVREDDPATFSLDGEMVEATELTLETRHRALTVPVGEAYDPDPDTDPDLDGGPAATEE